ncbi:MAG: hypothetical protein ACR2LS_05945 [Thermomicrobiales bacterium]|jgi:hypothetical protein
MSWWQIWQKNRGQGNRPDITLREGTRTAVHDGRVVRPAKSTTLSSTSKGSDRRQADLERRRQGLIFDIDQGELAQTKPNPWSERIALLDETLTTIAADREAVEAAPQAPFCQVPDVPIHIRDVTSGEPATVRFDIGAERFFYAEEIDWDQRGGAIVQGDLRHQKGDVAAIVPADTPEELRPPLARHLAASTLTFATALRDWALAGEPLPIGPTLRDLASPCPKCGGWSEWGGRCPACAERDLQLQELHTEMLRIQDERATEAEIRHRLMERIPIARRRLADVEAELATLRSKTS